MGGTSLAPAVSLVLISVLKGWSSEDIQSHELNLILVFLKIFPACLIALYFTAASTKLATQCEIVMFLDLHL